jgi:uncharacterized membrane protein YwzB
MNEMGEDKNNQSQWDRGRTNVWKSEAFNIAQNQSSHHPSSPPSRPTPSIIHSSILIVLVLLCISIVFEGCASTTNEQLVKKQLALGADRRFQFDQVFFNEIWLWNQTSWRYGNPSGAKRQKEFEAMAEQGYLPAYVALKMFDFEKLTKKPDAAAFNLLRQAADAGDVSAACAMMPIWAWNSIDGYPRDYEWSKLYVELGTKAGHFACQEQMAVLYRQVGQRGQLSRSKGSASHLIFRNHATSPTH